MEGTVLLCILYMDESGVEELKSGTSHFVLLGLMVPAGEWRVIDKAISDAKAPYGLRDVEIHAAWMSRRYSEQEAIPDFETLDPRQRRAAAEAAVRRRAGVIGVHGGGDKVKAYRREVRAIGPYLHLSRRDRLACLEDLAQKLAAFPDVRIFADAISKPDFASADLTPYEMAFEQVLSRYSQ